VRAFIIEDSYTSMKELNYITFESVLEAVHQIVIYCFVMPNVFIVLSSCR
jgi:hypothetical protein